ncbi:MAG: 50S ribosomal protein L11 methyltransferase [Syntrophomonadaceae bacterium]|nr:50S ribosomal protein L11 methyltransferase [Syntrophomonadaceae bacterium]
MEWQEVSVVTTAGVGVEAVSGIFYTLGSKGVAIEDCQEVEEYINRNTSDLKSVSPDLLRHDLVVVKAYFPQDQDIAEQLKVYLEQVKDNCNIDCEVFINEVRDEDWENSWKKYYHAFKVNKRLVVKPSWEDYRTREGEVVVEIDPGMAFGTGTHASTRFCLYFIDRYIRGGETVVDAGCGSAILSIAAAKLGAECVFSFDIDEVAVRVAVENIRLNNLQDKIEVRKGDIIEEIHSLKADVILANITAETVAALIPGAARILVPGGYLFGSGIVKSSWADVQRELTVYGFAIEEVLTDIDWVGVAARKL